MGGGGEKKKSGGSGDLIGGAMSAYKMFSGNKGGDSQAASAGAGGGGGAGDMIGGAMKAYKMFSGSKGGSGASGGGGGGGLFDNIGLNLADLRYKLPCLIQEELLTMLNRCKVS